VEVFNNLKNLLDEQNLIGGTWKTKIINSINLMEEHVELLNDDKEIENINQELIIDCINFMAALSIERDVSEIKEFFSQYIYLLFNWNENVLKDEKVKGNIRFLDRFINNTLTLSDTMEMYKKLINRLNTHKDILPPSFELSEHYFNLVREDD
jgi:hypothetical protein